MSNKKQSSIEWYANASHELIVKKDNGEITNREFLTMHHNLFYDAEAMHKEEVVKAFDEGQECEYQVHINSAPKYDSETYYNETFAGNNE